MGSLWPARLVTFTETVPVPAILPAPEGTEQSTQAAFGRVLLDLAKSGAPLADRIVTTAPDVTQTTNLGAFVNQRGLFRRKELADVFQKAKIPSAQKWAQHAAGHPLYGLPPGIDPLEGWIVTAPLSRP